MKLSLSLKLSLLGLAACTLFLSACDAEDVASCTNDDECSEDQMCGGGTCQPKEDNNMMGADMSSGTSTSSSTSGVTSTTANTTDTTSTGGTTTSSTSTSEVTSTSGTNTNNTATSTNNTATSTGTGTMIVTMEPDPCDAMPRPARCDEDPGMFMNWGPASVISEFKIVSDSSCCRDYDGDGSNDNGFAELVSSFASIDQVNTPIAENIADGSFAVVLEHEALDPMGGMFATNFLFGTPDGFTAPNPAGGNSYKVSRASFSSGVFANSRVAPMSFTATAGKGPIAGGPGKAIFPFKLLFFDFELPLREAYITGSIDSIPMSYTDGTGVEIVTGTLSGLIRLSDLFNGVSDFYATTCSCLEPLRTDNLIKLDNRGKFASCDAPMNPDYSLCVEGSETAQLCKGLLENCGLVGGILSNGADINADNVGQLCDDPFGGGNTCNAMSIGVNFTAVGAKITGVSP